MEDEYDFELKLREARKQNSESLLISDPGFSMSEKEYEEFLEYAEEEERRLKEQLILTKEYSAIVWLSKKIDYQSKNLRAVLERLRRGEDLYSFRLKEKSHGEMREICAPFRFLKMLQKRLNERFFATMPVNGKVFGFSGGNTKAAIRPHLKNKSLLTVDCKDAFPSIKQKNVINYLTRGRDATYNIYSRIVNVLTFGEYSWYAARIISEITTRKGTLPQGAPTSPRLFDLVCHGMDEKLAKLAENVKGNYTRYADNIFFSFPETEFPKPLKHAILKIVEGRRRVSGPNFNWHKLRISDMHKSPIRVLGFNIIDGKICNTRDYKRKVRIRIHHINWLLDHEMNFKDAWQKLHGLMSYAVKDTWPKKLREDYKGLRKRVKTLEHKRRMYIKK